MGKRRRSKTESQTNGSPPKKMKLKEDASDDSYQSDHEDLSNQEPKGTLRCSWCSETGHSDQNCPNMNFCRKCGSEDHTTSKCDVSVNNEDDEKDGDTQLTQNENNDDDEMIRSDTKSDTASLTIKDKDDDDNNDSDDDDDEKAPTTALYTSGNYQSLKYRKARYEQAVNIREQLENAMIELPDYEEVNLAMDDLLALKLDPPMAEERIESKLNNAIELLILENQLMIGGGKWDRRKCHKTDQKATNKIVAMLLQWKIKWLITVLKQRVSRFECRRCGEFRCHPSICDGEYNPLCGWCKKHGHLKSDCPELTAKICKKCGKNGTEHNFLECTVGRTWICFECGETGHRKEFCPVYREKKKKEEKMIDFVREPVCNRCGGQGHLEKQCKAINRIKCFRCNKIGHTIQDCMVPRKRKGYNARYYQQSGDMICKVVQKNDYDRNGPPRCWNCDDKGHWKEDCPHPSVETFRFCKICQENGHWTRECPQKVKCTRCKKFGHTVDQCIIPKGGFCYICGAEGHWSDNCTLVAAL